MDVGNGIYNGFTGTGYPVDFHGRPAHFLSLPGLGMNYGTSG